MINKDGPTYTLSEIVEAINKAKTIIHKEEARRQHEARTLHRSGHYSDEKFLTLTNLSQGRQDGADHFSSLLFNALSDAMRVRNQ